jgi:hypothetical protein
MGEKMDQISKIKKILEEYINGEADIYTTAKKIVDSLWTWEKDFMPLLSYNIDPWQVYNNRVLYIEEIIAACGDVVDQGLGYNDLASCVLDVISNSDP